MPLCLRVMDKTRSLRVRVLLDGRIHAGEFSVELPKAIVEQMVAGTTWEAVTHRDGYHVPAGSAPWRDIQINIEATDAVHVEPTPTEPEAT